MSVQKAVAAGAMGALATNIAHEALRRVVPDAPRVDHLGMQGIARISGVVTGRTPKGRTLYGTTLATDLVSNGAYFALVGAVPKRSALLVGAGLGAAAGIGSVVLPGPLGFDTKTTARTPRTALLSAAIYLLGGIVAGLAYSRLSST